MFKSRLNLLKQYHAAVDAKEIHLNTHQEHILKILETCYQRKKLFRFPWQKKYIPQNNIYIYGSVGSGKTFIMDLFFDAIPHQKKLRTHFHQFMEQIAEDLRQYQGLKNPMQKIVNELTKNYQVICLDEMMVQDVVQAMLLLELIPTLMSQDVMLVFTSNIKPSDLYLNGLQRDRFMQVINYIEEYAHVCCLTSSVDYRMQRLPLPAQTYFFPPVKQKFQDLFMQFAKHLKEEIQWDEKLLIQKREIASIASTKDLVWFEFSNIAVIPRCQRDYLEIAKLYKTVFISDVPQFKPSETANVILWMYLVDVFYNAQVKLIISAEVSMDELYQEGPLEKEFKRTISRMREMQTQWYWDLS